MKKITQILRSVIILSMTALMFTACVDKEYDDLTTANVDPDIQVTKSIKELQALATSGSTGVLITTDEIIAGVVTGDDLSGNIYKKLILQQDSSGIAIQLDVSNFNTEYPTGRRVFVKCKGLYIRNDGGNVELGSSPGSANSSMGRIPANLRTKYLFKGMWGLYITPKVYTFDNPNIPTNTLVQFNNVQFDAGYSGVSYATASQFNLDMIDCDSNILILYSSQYSTFATAKTPFGKGTITGVFIMYRGEGELQIRDTNDVSMNGLRCDNSTGIPTFASLDSIRPLYLGTPINMPNLIISVTVISNYSTNMLGLNSRNMYVQEDTTGIQLRFDAAPTFAVGSKLEININGGQLSTFNDVLQLTNLSLSGVTVIGSGNITPRITSIADITANYNSREATLVTIPGVTITGTGTYNGAAGSNTLTDATGSMVLYTGSSATFKSSAYPIVPVSVTGILTQFSGTYEILIRDTTDVQ